MIKPSHDAVITMISDQMTLFTQVVNNHQAQNIETVNQITTGVLLSVQHTQDNLNERMDRIDATVQQQMVATLQQIEQMKAEMRALQEENRQLRVIIASNDSSQTNKNAQLSQLVQGLQAQISDFTQSVESTNIQLSSSVEGLKGKINDYSQSIENTDQAVTNLTNLFNNHAHKYKKYKHHKRTYVNATTTLP